MKIEKYRKTKGYKSLMGQFDEWEKYVLKWPKRKIFDQAWEIYFFQLVRNMLNGDTPCALDKVTEDFAGIVWDRDKFKKFTEISCWSGVEDIYEQGERASFALWSLLSDFAKIGGVE